MTDELNIEQNLSRRKLVERASIAAGGIVLAGPLLRAGRALAASDSIKVGLLAPISGPLAPYGDHLSKGAKLGVELINAKGGIGGRKIELILEDDKTDPATAANRARKLLFKDRVDVLMGTISSATTLAVLPQVERAKKPYIYVIEGEDKTCGPNGATRKYVFGHGETPEQKMSKFIPYLVNNLGKKVYFIGSDYVFPHFVFEITQGILKKNGGRVAGTAYAPLGTSEFSTYVSKIGAANPDVLFIAVVGTDGIAFVKQATEFGLRKKMKFTGIPSFDPTVFPGIAGISEGIYTVDRYWEGERSALNQEFVRKYRAKYKYTFPVSGTAAMSGYGTLLIFKAAIEKAGSTDADAIAKALEGLKVRTPAGEIKIDPKNHIATLPMRLLQIRGNKYALVRNFGLVSHPGHHGCSSAKA